MGGGLRKVGVVLKIGGEWKGGELNTLEGTSKDEIVVTK